MCFCNGHHISSLMHTSLLQTISFRYNTGYNFIDGSCTSSGTNSKSHPSRGVAKSTEVAMPARAYHCCQPCQTPKSSPPRAKGLCLHWYQPLAAPFQTLPSIDCALSLQFQCMQSSWVDQPSRGPAKITNAKYLHFNILTDIVCWHTSGNI